MTWQEANSHYLSVAIHWLRLRLQRMIPDTTVTEDELAEAETRMLDAEAIEPPPALITLSSILGLTRFEQLILLLCVAMELDTQIASFCAKVQDDPARCYPTYALALSLFDHPVWDVVSPERPLRSWRLIEIHQSGVQPLTVSAIKADERIVNYAKGLNYLDDRLNSLLAPLDADQALAPSQHRVVNAIVEQLEANGDDLPKIQLLGSDRSSKQSVALAVVEQFEIPLYRMRVELLPTHASELETLIRLWQREIQLFPIAVYLDGQPIENNAAAALKIFLESTQGLFFLDMREQTSSFDQPSLSFEVEKPTSIEQWQIWQEFLGQSNHAGLLAGQFNLNLTEIQQAANTTQFDRLWESCLMRTRPRLDALAQRLDTKATWENIVLPQSETNLLHQIAAQVRHRSIVYDEWGFRDRMNRGLGVTALFAGESGTGKTMAAEVIANELKLNLYRIDLSAVVSKYIGETEKNLRKLFDAAEDGGAILFFDEADALFGKRSEVKDSHDRYANIETNYLLQRIEAYRGLAILATNLKSSLDQAFMRRLRFVINFPFPSISDRQRLWEKVFPPQIPKAKDLDYAWLARLPLTGGSIMNIALNSAFEAAASEERQITMPLVLTVARTEFRKLDRPVNEADFVWKLPETKLKSFSPAPN
ncbi:ATP-binding protein [Leptolyngbya sp. AN10]|uniref:ATP-binding protein n=1 Tax=Leptolyngbya sp. AN10 TaxID=3423365 RepID=UPI003D31B08F